MPFVFPPSLSSIRLLDTLYASLDTSCYTFPNKFLCAAVLRGHLCFRGFFAFLYIHACKRYQFELSHDDALWRGLCYSYAALLHVRFPSAGFDASKLSGHTFRRGAASSAAAVGFNNYEIQQLGRWRSDSYYPWTVLKLGFLCRPACIGPFHTVSFSSLRLFTCRSLWLEHDPLGAQKSGRDAMLSIVRHSRTKA